VLVGFAFGLFTFALFAGPVDFTFAFWRFAFAFAGKASFRRARGWAFDTGADAVARRLRGVVGAGPG
jgi:hypothetical protein